jgi:hypothetical protein
MKKEKLLVKEIKVLSGEISKRVDEVRKKKLKKLVEGDKEYIKLKKEVDVFNVEVVKMVKRVVEFNEKVDKIRERLKLEKYSGVGEGLGYIKNSCWGGNSFSLSYGINSLREDKVFNRLMIDNIDGDLKVNELIERMVEEYSK